MSRRCWRGDHLWIDLNLMSLGTCHSDPMSVVPQQQHWAVLQFIEDQLKRQKRSLDHVPQSWTKREHKRGSIRADKRGKAVRRRRRRNKGCVLKEIHLNITDLELGYDTQEELMFKYCSGSCEVAETTYDLILKNLTKNKKLGQDNVQPRMCCRPTAFEDNLSFLDSHMAYQTLQRYSAKKCGCV
ncbi:glial cell line-derived neurotrophic factor isoform X2 [Callorhinchus milii]|uniref:glial cell line-derived neurotrophic factor isoform X2 n=1 Tax=Callorhinchus milii TaxID=7868 RepID=UPI001C3F6829|nr:glial cell line-derived neurotrophic factor isoform X2 [Callorhinchus milii]